MTGRSPGGEAEVQPARLSTSGLLSDATRRLRRHPDVVATFLVVGGVLAGIDWVRRQDPVPALEYAGVQDGQVTIQFTVVVTITQRTGLHFPALLGLERPWLLARVGLELFALLAITIACVDALGRLLDVDPSAPAVLRYGIFVALLALPRWSVDVPLELGLLLSPVLLVVAYVFVRLVPFPGRLALDEGFVPALRRSWRSTRGHGWALFGVVLVVGLANHLLTSVPVVGPIGSGVVAALHAGVVTSVMARVGDPPSLASP